MVHKKSEYKLQFHFLPKDLRKQIWQENIRFREYRKSVNQAHHYWSYQINDDPCVCDTPDEGANLQINGHRNGISPPSCEVIEKRVESPTKGSDSCSSKKRNSVGRQVQLEEPGSTGILAQEVAVQTPDWMPEDRNRRSRGSPELHQMMQNLSTSTTDIEGSKKKETHSGRSSQASSDSRSPPLPSSPPRCDEHCKPSSAQSAPVRSILHSGSGDSSKRPSRFSSLSKTSRKGFFDDKKSPFAYYGWNDDSKSIGEKKTYNVNAPESEVHWEALRAQKRRKDDIEKYLAREADHTKRAQQNKSPVNISSIWMSEYQDKYGGRSSRGVRVSRPASAPLLYSPECWRYS